ncbi:phosphatidate phosphatase APP1 [Arcanobacterium wilhelmae]|uniref:Phosphatidate phosphatase APP1 n=1 Tax=Arcanobacterium wilhelmae TaxID=1803177 RepID=A0ABT9NBF3_9ACTO|nr:phosphatase domain-containing protein [Arcanobacterium wilhelmae]MDP9801049.1 phosphatidate phosphatase APP1 [Arcanobacterium wilhelmae]WFN90406.1 DUF2183 domain-containing protein [Arcanobacterium wilhelmae]
MALSDLVRNIEGYVNRRNIVRRREQGWLPRITPYMGYGNTHQLRVLARAVMAPPPEQRLPSDVLAKIGLTAENQTAARAAFWDAVAKADAAALEAQRGWNQFFTTQVGFVRVEVEIGGRTYTTRTDRQGYVDLVIENHSLEPGIHDVVLTPAAGEPATAQVTILSPEVRRGIVSDIDDTILVTWLPRAALASWNSFVKHTNSRQPVPHMAQFYRALREGSEETPVFYLSTGAWNTYDTLRAFMKKSGFPVGPMLMTDWGPTPTGLFRSGQEHKKTQLRNLMIMFPQIEWVLIGDDGQHDPLIYDEVAREHPSRVRAIALRELGPVEQVLAHGSTDPAETNRRESDIENAGVPVVRGRDGLLLMSAWKRRLGTLPLSETRL